jgi:hypothetical protein
VRPVSQPEIREGAICFQVSQSSLLPSLSCCEVIPGDLLPIYFVQVDCGDRYHSLLAEGSVYKCTLNTRWRLLQLTQVSLTPLSTRQKPRKSIVATQKTRKLQTHIPHKSLGHRSTLCRSAWTTFTQIPGSTFHEPTSHATSTDPLDRLLALNRLYAQHTTAKDPNAFVDLAKGQAPEILWLGCSDSRLSESTICQCQPGDIFVHRNIANTMHANDINSASVVEYAVTHLKVKKVVVCGHTKCGGATAALGDADLGQTLNTWLHPVRE